MNIQAKLTFNTELDGILPDKETLEQAFFDFINSGVVLDIENDEWALLLKSVVIDLIVMEDESV